MDKRKETILAAVIEEYTNKASPVGSDTLARRRDFDLSPATIRAEMAELEKEDYLFHPHVSAGRVPTDKGYRFFVDALKREGYLTSQEQAMLQKEFLKFRKECSQLAKATAKLLAFFSHNLALSAVPAEGGFCRSGLKELFQEPEFSDRDQIASVVDLLDYLEDNIDELFRIVPKDRSRVYIGNENPFGDIPQCSMVISGYEIPKRRGLVAIIGPKRMKYARNISLVEYVSRVLG